MCCEKMLTSESIRYYDNGNIRAIEYRDDLGRYHTDDTNPAVSIFWEDGKTLRYEIWYKHGIFHRFGGFAWISYDKEGKVLLSKYYIEGREYGIDIYD